MNENKKIHPKMYSDMLKEPSENLISLQSVSDRLSICRKCPHWYESKFDYRCYVCGCNNNIFIKTAKCPLRYPKW
jgi:rubrerythrin